MFLSIFREYSYDAWGNITGVYDEKGRPVTNPNDSAFLNPLRYRSYYYDDESGLYYLKSRYYNPEWGRFISVDSVVSGTGESVNGYNVYSYCFNNPITLTDPSGCWPEWMKKAANWFDNNIVKPVKETFSFFNHVDSQHFTTPSFVIDLGYFFGNLETLFLHSFSQVKYRN